MSSIKIECVASEGYRIGESPVWDEKERALLCVDITGKKVCRWSSLTQQVQAISVGKEWLEKRSSQGKSCVFRLGAVSLPNTSRTPVGDAAASLNSCTVLIFWRSFPKI